MKPTRICSVVRQHDRLSDLCFLAQLLDKALYQAARIRWVQPDIADPLLPKPVARFVKPACRLDCALRERVRCRIAVNYPQYCTRSLEPFRRSVPLNISRVAS